MPNGQATLAMFAVSRSALRLSGDNGFQSDIGRQWRIRRARCLYAGFGYKEV